MPSVKILLLCLFCGLTHAIRKLIYETSLQKKAFIHISQEYQTSRSHKTYSLTLGKESCSGAKRKYQFTLILHLVLITLDNDFGGVDYDNSKQLKVVKKKKKKTMDCFVLMRVQLKDVGSGNLLHYSRVLPAFCQILLLLPMFHSWYIPFVLKLLQGCKSTCC